MRRESRAARSRQGGAGETPGRRRRKHRHLEGDDPLSQIQFDTIYARLGVKFDFALGESFYNPWLGGVVNDLLKRGIARESEGAVGVFSDGSLPPKAGSVPRQPRRRVGWRIPRSSARATAASITPPPTWRRLITGSRPGRRMKSFMSWTTGSRRTSKNYSSPSPAGSPDAAKKVKLVHVGFGKILGDDGKPFKTRSGDTVKLGDLLDEAEERAFKIVSEKSAELPEAQRREIARVIGLGAVKYADLLPNRQSDYIFSWDKMLALQGNTAPYLQYAYARIQSIFRKSETPNIEPQTSNIALTAPEELALARHLLNFGLTLEAVADEYRPNYLCNYLFELAGKFTSFYENCPVLKADHAATRDSRLALCALTARVLKQGLDTLGIQTVEQMSSHPPPHRTSPSSVECPAFDVEC
jgi:arginyl-tRNA synthetase